MRKPDSIQMLQAIAWDKAYPPAPGEMSAQEAVFYGELEDELCRCVGDDNSRCLPHNERFHSMDGIEEYYALEHSNAPTSDEK